MNEYKATCSVCEQEVLLETSDIQVITDRRQKLESVYRFIHKKPHAEGVSQYSYKTPGSSIINLLLADGCEELSFNSKIPIEDIDNKRQIVTKFGEITIDEEIDFGLMSVDALNAELKQDIVATY